MKKVKKILALVLVAVMMMAMSVTALAVDITITADTTNIDPTAVTYTYYKIFDAIYASNETTDASIAAQAELDGFAYTIPASSPLLTISGETATIDGITDITLTKSAAGTEYIVKYNGAMTEDAAKAMAAALQTKINGLTDAQKALLTKGTLTYDSADKKYKATGLDAGYYLIESDSNTKLVLATTDINITEKNSYVTDKKELVNTTTDDSVQIGDIIPYKLTVNIPAGSNLPIVITDTYEAGLTPKVAQNTDNTADYYVDSTASPSTAGQVYVTATVDSAVNTAFAVSVPSSTSGTAGNFTITLTADQVTALAGKTIIFTYYAELNQNAEVRDSSDLTVTNDNTVTLQYGNNYDTTPSEVKVTTQTIELTKYDGADGGAKTPIAGAIFELRNGSTPVKLVKVSDTEYRVATPEEIAAYNGGTPTAYTDETTPMANGAVTTNVRTVAGTKITVKGLDDDVTYTWVETKAPTGYNPTASNDDVTPGKGAVVNTEIANNKGTVLPSTGGIGTTIFYVVGGLLVAAAIVVLVTKRRMAGEE